MWLQVCSESDVCLMAMNSKDFPGWQRYSNIAAELMMSEIVSQLSPYLISHHSLFRTQKSYGDPCLGGKTNGNHRNGK